MPFSGIPKASRGADMVEVKHLAQHEGGEATVAGWDAKRVIIILWLSGRASLLEL